MSQTFQGWLWSVEEVQTVPGVFIFTSGISPTKNSCKKELALPAGQMVLEREKISTARVWLYAHSSSCGIQPGYDFWFGLDYLTPPHALGRLRAM